jgi:hypothetical protein
MNKLYIFFLAILITTIGFAQAPEKFNYQAVLSDASGNLENQSVGMQISILNGATVVYTETQTSTTNAYGLVNLEIGAGTTTDNFSTISWGTGTYFVKIEVDPTGGTNYTLISTSQLLSVPYAIHSKTADTVLNADDADWTITGNNIYRASGDVGIGTTTPNSLLHLKAPGTAIGDGIHFETSGGTAEDWYVYMNVTDDINFRNDAKEVLTLQKNTGNIGIGTTLPDAKLHLIGSLKIVDGTQAVGRVLTTDADGLASWQDAVSDDGDWVTSGANLYSANTGNIGVGTITPNSTFHINNSGGTEPAFRVQNFGNTKFSVNTNGGTTIGAFSDTGAPDNGLYVFGPTVMGTQTQATGYMLSVNGKIIGEDVVILDSGSWPDYVFEKDYNLLTIEELAKLIEEKKHLPGIPSAKEVEANGILLGDMQKRTMEKIEELSLYIIQLHERLKVLEKENVQLKINQH